MLNDPYDLLTAVDLCCSPVSWEKFRLFIFIHYQGAYFRLSPVNIKGGKAANHHLITKLGLQVTIVCIISESANYFLK